MKKRTLLSLVMVLVLAVGAALGTYAWFTGNTQTEENSIQTGQIHLSLKSNPNDDGDSQIFTLGGKHKPGDTLANARFEIINDGDFDAVYFDNFKLVGGNLELADKIYIKNARNSLWKKVGDQYEQVWEWEYFTDGNPRGGFVPGGYYDSNNDGKVSLSEWLNANNRPVSIGNGWHYSALKQGNKFVTEFELALDTTADNRYANKSINIAYQVYSTQYNQEAAQDLIEKTIKPSFAGNFDWGFVVGQYSQQ